MFRALLYVQKYGLVNVVKYGAKSLNFKRIIQDKNKILSNQMAIIFYFLGRYLI